MAFPNTNKDTTTNNQLQDIIDLLQNLIAAGNCCDSELGLLNSIDANLSSISYSLGVRDTVENTHIERFPGASMDDAITAFRSWAIANSGNDMHVQAVFADTTTSICVVWNS